MSSHDVLRALGFSRSELAGGSLAVHSPIYGAEIARIAETPVSEVSAVIARRRARSGLGAKSRRPAAPPGRTRAPFGRRTVRRQIRTRRLGHAGGGQDRLRGTRRSAGDDRHLLFRGWFSHARFIG
jgi:hypothetical protein